MCCAVPKRIPACRCAGQILEGRGSSCESALCAERGCDAAVMSQGTAATESLLTSQGLYLTDTSLLQAGAGE